MAKKKKSKKLGGKISKAIRGLVARLKRLVRK